MSESGGFRLKNRLKPNQNAHFEKCFLESLVFLQKNEKSYAIFQYMNKITNQSQVFAIKIDFGNVSESGEFRFKNSLKEKISSLNLK